MEAACGDTRKEMQEAIGFVRLQLGHPCRSFTWTLPKIHAQIEGLKSAMRCHAPDLLLSHMHTRGMNQQTKSMAQRGCLKTLSAHVSNTKGSCPNRKLCCSNWHCIFNCTRPSECKLTLLPCSDNSRKDTANWTF